MGIFEQSAINQQQNSLNEYYEKYIRSQYQGLNAFEQSRGLQNTSFAREPKKEVPDEVLLLLEV